MPIKELLPPISLLHPLKWYLACSRALLNIHPAVVAATIQPPHSHSKPETGTVMVLLNGLILLILIGLTWFCVLINDYEVVTVVGILQLKYPCPTEAVEEVRRQHRLSGDE